MLWEVSVIEVCEILWKLPAEREVAAQKSMHSLSKLTVLMLSKTPFVLKLYRSHISANVFFTDASFQLGEKKHTVKLTHVFYYAKPSRRSFKSNSSVYTAQKEEMGFLSTSWTFEVLSRSQKGLVSIPGEASPLHPWHLLAVWSGRINDLPSHWQINDLSKLIRKSTLSCWMFWCYLGFVRASLFLGGRVCKWYQANFSNISTVFITSFWLCLE